MNPIHLIRVPHGPLLAVSDLPSASLGHAAFDLVISLVDPGTRLSWSHSRHHVFCVADQESGGEGGPTPAFLDALLGVDLAGAGSILIHCHAGYSRSPAAAMLLARKLGAGLKAIEAGIDWTRADPNRRILALGEARLGSGRPLQKLAARRARRL